MMKKICLLVLVMVLGKMWSYAQYPVTQYIGTDSAVVISKGALQSRLINVTYTDTSAANLQRIRQYPGAQIATTTGGINLWVRNLTATAWIPVATGSGNNIYTIDGTLLGNRTLTGGNNSLTFTGLSSFLLTVGNQTFTVRSDSAALTRKLSYSSNRGSTFTLYSLVDKNYVDSAITASPAGTVTQVNTNNGSGITGGPITSTGTLAIDTLLISTRAWRQKGVDSLQANINLKLNIADTTGMLANYFNKVGYGLSRSGQTVYVDSASLANYFIRRKDSLTATNPLGYVTKKVLADTAAAIRSADAGGSVTSVATNNGTGITGGTITTSGTLAIDTTLISTRAWRQKGVDSLQANINTKLNISDTASMLSPYLRSNTAAATYVPQTRTITINGTTQDLSANRTYNVGTVTSVATNYGLSGGTITSSGTLSVDSATLSNYYLRRKDSLTSTNLLGYVTRKVLADTAAAIRGADAGGTVTSVATNTATGITGGTITTSGTLAIDTLLISTRAWRQKGIDSVAALLPAAISGTTNYIPKFTSSSAIGNSTIQTDATGNLMVGSSDAGNAGTINVSVGVAGTTAGGLQLWASNSQTHYIQFGDGTTGGQPYAGFLGYAHSADALVFGTATSERMRLTSGGSLGIGTSAPSYTLDVNGTIRASSYFTSDYYRDSRLEAMLIYAGSNQIRLGSGVGADFLTFYSGGSERMRLDASGNLGIGTSSPAAKLDVYQSATGTTAFNTPIERLINTGTATLNQRIDLMMRWEDGTYNGTGGISMIRESATGRSGSLVFSSINSSGDATQAMRLDASGNLGLGVTPSAWSLGKAIDISDGVGILGYNNATQIANNAYYNGGWKYKATSAASNFVLANDGSYQFNIAPSGTAGNAISFTQAMTLDASGNLAVATTTASNSAVGRGNITIGGSATSILNFQIGGTLAGYLYHDNTNLNILNSNASGALLFSTNASERMRITSGGNVLVGTTTDAGYKLDVAGSLRNTTSAYFATSSGSVGIGTTSPSANLNVVKGASSVSAASNAIAVFENNANGVVQINGPDANSLGLYFARSGSPYYAGIERDGTNLLLKNNSAIAVTITSANNVGIGTVSPDSMLTVTQGAYLQRGVRLSGLPSGIGTKELRIDANGVVYANDTLTNDISGSGTTNYIPKFTSSSAIGNSVIYESSSNIGVGGTVTTQKLTINGSGLADLGLYDSGEATDQKTWSFQGGTSVGAGNFRLRAVNDAGTNGQNAYIINKSGITINNHQWLVGGSEQMRLTSTGLGIGTSNPAYKLHVSGTGGTMSTLTNVISRFNATTNTNGEGSGIALTAISTKETGVILGAEHTSGSNGDFVIKIYNGGADYPERLRLTASGNLGVGITPAAKLDVSASSGTLFRAEIAGVAQLNIGNGGASINYYDANTQIFRLGNGTEQMRLNSTGLGIGNSNPSAKLDVLGRFTVRDTDGASDVRLSGVTNRSAVAYFYEGATQRAYIGSAAGSDNFVIGTGTSTRATFDASGNLGLGVTPSAWSLGKAIDISGGVGILGYNNGTQITNNAYYNGGWIYKATSYAQNFVIDNDGSFKFLQAPSGTAGNAISFTQAMTLDASGRLGIGTTSPTGKLTVSQNNSGGVAAIYLTEDESTIQGPSSNTQIRMGGNLTIAAASTMPFLTNGSERMRITSSGELQVTGNGVIKNQESGGNYSYWQQTSSDARLAVQYSQPLLFLTNATERMRITSGGLVGIGNTIPASYNADANDLVVGTTSGNNGITVVSGSNANGGLYFADGITGSEQYRGYIDYGHTTDYLAFGTAGVEKVRITSAGNVGIGTTSPNIGTWNQALTLNTASGNAAYELAVAGSAQLYLAADNSNAYLQVANATSPLRVFTGGSERMRITSGGNLLIGTTTDLGNNLQVLGSGLFYTNSTTGSTALLTLSRNVTGYGQTTFQQSYHSTFYTNGKTLTLKNDSNTEFAHFAGNNAGTITDLIIPTGSIKTAAPSGGSAQTWKLGEGNVTIGGSDGKAVKVEIDGTLYYLMTGYLPEPEPEAMSGPSMGYKAKFEEPVIKIKSDNQKIKDLEKEIAELKAMMKVLIEKK